MVTLSCEGFVLRGIIHADKAVIGDVRLVGSDLSLVTAFQIHI